MSRYGLLLLALGACSSSSSSSSTSNRTSGGQPPAVNVELSGVTLAEDCGDAAPARVAPPKEVEAESKSASQPRMQQERDIAAGACADPSNCDGPRRGCTPTSMQLAVRAPSDAKPTTIRIKKVELLDPKGNVLETLASRGPSKWDQRGAYVAWNEQVAAGERVEASYLLATPDWNKHAGGKWNAHAKVFQLRVTVAVGDAERTIEKQSVVPAMLAPEVET
jgi:hypothetical protein